MIGDTSYDELFQEERSSSTVYEILSNLLYLMFLLLMSVVFVNFILALTISDIKVNPTFLKVSVNILKVFIYLSF